MSIGDDLGPFFHIKEEHIDDDTDKRTEYNKRRDCEECGTPFNVGDKCYYIYGDGGYRYVCRRCKKKHTVVDNL